MRAGAPLQRRTPLARSPMKRRTSRRVARKSDGDKAYTAWIHTQPCCMEDVGGHVCRTGRIEQSHLRNMTGLGLKAPDIQSVPMCSTLHRAWEAHSVWFSGWTKEQRLAWMLERIAVTQAAYLRDGGVL